MIFFQQGKLHSEEHDAFRKALFYFELEEEELKPNRLVALWVRQDFFA